MAESLDRRLARVRAVVMDVDGVLTDAGMYYASDGTEMKKFSARDGMGVGNLCRAGLRVAFISGEDIPAIRNRARKLGVTDLYLGARRKGEVLERFRRRHRLAAEEVLFIGDDLNDLPAMRGCGVPVAVRGAVPEVCSLAVWVTRRRGGEGAVREVSDRVLKAKKINPGKWFER